MRDLGREVEDNSGELVRRLAVTIDQVVVVETPVDTGRARINWQIGLDGPAQGTLPEPPTGGGSAAQLSMDKAAADIAKHKNGQAIHITNNLDYIGRLNDGYSAQAPANFVEMAVVTAIKAIGAYAILDSSRNGRTIFNDGPRK